MHGQTLNPALDCWRTWLEISSKQVSLICVSNSDTKNQKWLEVVVVVVTPSWFQLNSECSRLVRSIQPPHPSTCLQPLRGCVGFPNEQSLCRSPGGGSEGFSRNEGRFGIDGSESGMKLPGVERWSTGGSLGVDPSWEQLRSLVLVKVSLLTHVKVKPYKFTKF